MTHSSCPDCRLRFTAAVAAYLPACPHCGEPIRPLDRADGALGYRLYQPTDDPHSLPEAIAVEMPDPDLR